MKTKFTVIVIGLVMVGLVNATPGTTPSREAKAKPTQFALIDMAHVFKNYDEFKDRREALKAEIKESDARAKVMVDNLKTLQIGIKESENAKEKAEMQKQFIEVSSKYQIYRKTEQARFLEKEAKIYKEVYVHVQDIVADFAKKRRHALVLRFNSETPADAKDSKTILSRMNRQVIYHESGTDITADVLKEVNRRYRERMKK